MCKHFFSDSHFSMKKDQTFSRYGHALKNLILCCILGYLPYLYWNISLLHAKSAINVEIRNFYSWKTIKKNGFGKYVFLTGILVQKGAVVLIGGRIGFPLPTGRVKIVLILFRFSLFANPSGGNDYFSKNFGNLN